MLLARSDYEKVHASMMKKYFDFGFHYSFSLIVFLMTLVFSSTIPLVVPFGCLFFYVKYYFDKYNLLFFYPAEFESQGNIGKVVIKFMLFAIFFFQVIMSGLFYFMKEIDESAGKISILYIVVAVILYFVSNRIFKIDNNYKSSSKLFQSLRDRKNNKSKKLIEMKEFDSTEVSLADIGTEMKPNQEDSHENLQNPVLEIKHKKKYVYSKGVIKNTDLCVKMLKDDYVPPVCKESIIKEKNIHMDLVRTMNSISAMLTNTIEEKKEEEGELYVERSLSIEDKKYLDMLKSAYTHPTQKKLMDNPMFAYNDNFRYLKNLNNDSEEREEGRFSSEATQYSDYSSIIKKIKYKEKNKIIEMSEQNNEVIEELFKFN